MTRLHLHLLGPPRATIDDRPAEIQRRKVWALLIYLCVTDETQRRDTLATLLWPDASQPEGRAALSRHLSELRTIIGPERVTADRENVGLTGGLWLDVHDFQQLAADCFPSQPDCLGILTEAVKLYRDDFLKGFTLSDSPDFDEWQFFETEKLRHTFAALLERLVQLYDEQNEHAAALPYARRRLALDSLHEPAHRTLMRLYALTGQQSAALRQYQVCTQSLADELGIAPSNETTALYEQIRSGELIQSVSPDVLPQVVHPVVSIPKSIKTQPDGYLVVARERELAQLDSFLDQALNGQGRVVFVTGEAGGGKTTLVQAFARQAKANLAHLIVSGGNCTAYTGSGDPYLAFREVLWGLWGGRENEGGTNALGLTLDPRDRQQVAVQTIQAIVKYAPDLIGTFVPGAALLEQAHTFTSTGTELLYELQKMVPRREGRQGSIDVGQINLFQQFSSVVESLAQVRPLLLILDDLQWADAGSIDLLFHLGRRLSGQQILIVGAYRPADVDLGRPTSKLGQMRRHPLEPVVNEFRRTFGANQIDLQQSEGQSLVEGMVDSESNRLGQEFRSALYHHTQGHALFTIEVLREMQARGDLVQDEAGYWVEGARLQWEQLPARVEGVIGERIGRLEPDLRQLLNAASVMGDEFTAEVMAQVLQKDERVVARQLGEVLDRQHHLVCSMGSQWIGHQRLSHHRFQHILFQNYLYQTLSPNERIYLHEDTGLALERLYAGQTEEVAASLAHHFQMAGLAEKAIRYLLQASLRARRMSAYAEAARHNTQALTLLAGLPQSVARDRQEFALQFNQGELLAFTGSMSAPESGDAHALALVVARRLGDPQQIAQALLALTQHARMRSELALARTYGEECLQLATASQNPELTMAAHRILYSIAHASGQHGDAVDHGDQVIGFYRNHRSNLTFDEAHNFASALSQEGLNLVPYGYPDRALAQAREAIALVQLHDHQFGIVQCTAYLAYIHLLRGEWQLASDVAEQAGAAALAFDFVQMRTLADLHRGVAFIRLGQAEKGTELVHQTIAERVAIGATFGNQTALVRLAEASGQVGRVSEGLLLIDEVLSHPDSRNDRQYEPKMYQIKGDLLLRQDKLGNDWFAAQQDAEVCLRRAIEIARSQGARLWEARALASLCRLLKSQGRGAKYRQELAELYAWFTEGFETEDLRVVKEVLDSSSSHTRQG